MDTVRSHLETLSEDAQGKVNFISWKFKLVLTLKSKSLYNIVNGLENKPVGDANAEQALVWTNRDIEAQTLIGLNVSSNIAMKIVNCTTSRQMLERLTSLYGTATDVTVEGLQRKFFSFTYDENKSAVENCMQVVQIAEELASENDPMRDNWIITRIISVLPSKLAHFRTAWDTVTGPDRTVEKLIERLRIEDERISSGENSSDIILHNALVSKHHKKQGQQQGNKQDKLSVICYKCGKPGHVIKYCRGKSCSKYLAHCKTLYPCNTCGEKGHFAKDCPQSDKKKTTSNNNRPALLTIGLSSAEMKYAKERQYKRNIWIQDCGASQHMTSHKEWFSNLEQFEEPITIVIGDATELEGVGIGDIEVEAYDGDKWTPVIMKDVLYVPRLDYNLFSVGQILDKGYIQIADKQMSRIATSDGQHTKVIAEREGNLYKMMLRREGQGTCMIAESIRIWHERLAHQNVKYVRNILNKSNVKYVDDWQDYICEGCIYGKQHRVSHPINTKVSEKPLDLIHVDLGEMHVTSIGGAKYFLLFKDDFSHFRTVYFLKTKDEAVAKLDIFLKLVENQFERRVKTLRSDNGLEIKNKGTRKLLEQLGVFHTFTNAYTPEQNGRIEREMRTVVEAARSAIHANGLNETLWAEAVNYAVFTINQTGTSSVPGKSPAELWFGRKMDVSKMKIFGCECFILKPDHKRNKFDKKSEKGIFVGYDTDSTGYRVYVPNSRRVISTDNVTFNEVKERTQKQTEVESRSRNETSKQDDQSEKSEESDYDDTMSITEEQTQEKEVEKPNEVVDEPSMSQSKRRSLRDRKTLKKPARLSDYVMSYTRGDGNAMIGEVEDIPVEKALKDANWHKAMKEEYDSLIKMKTWELMKCPTHARPLTCRWVLREKTNGKLKARLVARGFEQEAGIDYTETFSPVARHTSIRLLLSHAATEKMKVVTFDVKTAFLHGDLEEELYMHQPRGFDDGSEKVCRLRKSLYGLKQAPRKWNEKISAHLEKIGFTSTDDDPCIYYNEDRSIMISLFVDDGLIIGKREDAIFKVLNKINKQFEITYEKKFQKKLPYLGMELRIEPDGIFISQPKYTTKILKRFNHDQCNPVSTPIEKGMVTDEGNYENDRPVPAGTPYREAIGSLLYLATISRPDISFAVNYLSRHSSGPMMSHWKMVGRVFQYLRGTVDYGIKFDGGSELVAYTDSDYGGEEESRKSTSGVLLMRGGPLVWFSKKQHVVANSTAEAEYRAAVSSIDDVSWMRRICKELRILETDEPTTLYVDNESAITMLHNSHEGKTTKGKKHIEISRKFIQQNIGKTVLPRHVQTSCQLADILTKPLGKNLFIKLREAMVKEEC